MLLSVVIPTLGGECLAKTIQELNSGSVAPDEILVCIPQKEAQRAAALSGGNVRLVVTECRGQVAQRAQGFREAAGEFVLQLDDDMFPAKDCVSLLLETMRSIPGKVAVGAALFDSASARSFYVKPLGGFGRSLKNWLVNGRAGYQPGEFTLSGHCFGVDPALVSTPVCDVEWFAGGCALHRRENLVMDAFYPLPGKAYCEDLIHSHLLRERGVRLLIDTRAVCATEGVPADLESFKSVLSDYKARLYFVSISGRSFWRLRMWYALRMLSILLAGKSHGAGALL